MDKSPDAFRTISEVAEHLETPAHVLRFWESRFPQIRPVKRAGGRRYYRPADVALLTGIKRLLHDEGLTIRGVQKILREQGVRHVSGLSDAAVAEEEMDAEAALEAALAANFTAPEAEPLPQAEVETAQIFALETALRRPAVPQPVQASLFAEEFEAAPEKVAEELGSDWAVEEAAALSEEMAEEPVGEETALAAPDLPESGAQGAVQSPVEPPAADLAVADLTEANVWVLPDVPEAPIHLDAEPEAAVLAMLSAERAEAPAAARPDFSDMESPSLVADAGAAGQLPPLLVEDGSLLARLRALPPGALSGYGESSWDLLDRLRALRERLAAPALS